jgi:GNAT superfamily N-acetyltransferase
MDFSVRAAAADDAGPIAELSGELGYPVSAQAVRDTLGLFLGAPDHRVLVAEAGGRVCGWLQAHSCHVLESGLRVEVLGLVVSASMRRHGVGRALMAGAEAWAGEASAGQLVVRSNTQRAESHAFYPSIGYARTKTQAVYRKGIGPQAPF